MADEKKQKKDTEVKKKKEVSKSKADNTGMTSADGEEDEIKGGGLAVAVVVMLIVLVWLAIFALVVKTDVGGFGSSVLYPVLKDVPVVNKILPKSKEYAKEDSQYSYKTTGDAIKRIKELEKELKEAKKKTGANDAKLADLEAQSDRKSVV